MQLEVKEGIKIKIHNKDTGRGHYYPEDDWTIEAVGPTYEEAIELIIPEYINSGIYPSGNYVSNVKYVTYNNKQHVVDDTDKTPPTLIYKDVIMDIGGHPLFKKLAEDKRKKRGAEKIEKLKREKEIKEKHERELLEQLKKKYSE